MYPSFPWLPGLDCPWVAASPWLGNDVGGGGAPYAIDLGVPTCLDPMASCNLKNVLTPWLDDLKLFFHDIGVMHMTWSVQDIFGWWVVFSESSQPELPIGNWIIPVVVVVPAILTLNTLQTYLKKIMVHACFTPIALCFVYTLWHFYAFYGTNLLTRCHSASSYFLLYLYFRKLTNEIFSELDETKAKPPIFPDTKTNSKVETEEG
jgi:hypothetical protein